jgi:recombinational DNA repair protein RecT
LLATNQRIHKKCCSANCSIKKQKRKMESKLPNSAKSVMQVIQNTPPVQIAELDFVREKYIQNFNACHKEKVGELMYHRQVIHFKQAISNSSSLQKCDPFSLYACFATAAVNGYSMDPNDSEVYLIARGGKAYLDRQAGAYIRRLIRTGQIQYADQAKLVYDGDEFQVENSRVIRHVERFKSDIIIAGYIRMAIDVDGSDRYFIYRKSDWESWRKKSPNPRTIEKNGQNGSYLSESLWDNGIVGGTQPEPNFLRTKIVKHAAKEKCWATGITPAAVETYSEIEIDAEDEQTNGQPAFTVRETEFKAKDNTIAATVVNDDDFASRNTDPGLTVEDDTF